MTANISPPICQLNSPSKEKSHNEMNQSGLFFSTLVGMDAKHTTQRQWVPLLVRMKKWRGPRGSKLISLE